MSKQVVVREGDGLSPREVVEYGKKSAQVLKHIIETRKDKVVINGKTYLQFQDWQTIAKFYKTTVGVEWTKPIMREDKVFGYEAKANTLDDKGLVVSSAESSCSRDEKMWGERPDFQLRSMAQTRACAKALRNVFSWVVVLAGYESTPAEEMVVEAKEIKPVDERDVMKCEHCGTKIVEKVYNYSLQHFGRPLCYVHQKELQEVGELSKDA